MISCISLLYLRHTHAGINEFYYHLYEFIVQVYIWFHASLSLCTWVICTASLFPSQYSHKIDGFLWLLPRRWGWGVICALRCHFIVIIVWCFWASSILIFFLC